ncbi:hypothetical protein TL16_g11395 [Triparma laevis f. inornata]|uniref:Uncharacterized protein n=1 Tax=Triparma laevis f. inornata TaxID=1714386 RepID=A0A9W7BET8_9STRA|nr:hypothetical protein TL16_g11395 [Triparma laevis f. inornata]
MKPLKTFVQSHPDDIQSKPTGGPLSLTYNASSITLIPCIVGLGSYTNDIGESVEYLEGIRPDVGKLYEEHDVRGVVIISVPDTDGGKYEIKEAVVEQVKSVVKGFGSAAAVKEGGGSSGAAAGVCFELVNNVEGVWDYLTKNRYVGGGAEDNVEEGGEEEGTADNNNGSSSLPQHEQEQEQPPQSPPTSLYKCHQCRTLLFTSHHVSPHNPTCNSIHITHPNPLTQNLTYTPNSGKIYCFKCNNKVGSYNWSGVKCACKHWWEGGCTVNRSSVDEQGVEVVKNHEEVMAEKKGAQEKGGFRHDRGKSKPKHPMHKNFGKKDSSVGSFA